MPSRWCPGTHARHGCINTASCQGCAGLIGEVFSKEMITHALQKNLDGNRILFDCFFLSSYTIPSPTAFRILLTCINKPDRVTDINSSITIQEPKGSLLSLQTRQPQNPSCPHSLPQKKNQKKKISVAPKTPSPKVSKKGQKKKSTARVMWVDTGPPFFLLLSLFIEI